MTLLLIALKMEDALRRRVVGQDHIVEAVSHAVRISRAGLQAPNRPVASMMFLGPTGVGKVLCTVTSFDNSETLAPSRRNFAKHLRLSYSTMNREDCESSHVTFNFASKPTVSISGSTSTCPR
jgi:DNA polymerase III delta prime subunit